MRYLECQAISTGPGAISNDNLPLLADGIDRKDGGGRGLITDPRECRFDQLKDWLNERIMKRAMIATPRRRRRRRSHDGERT